MWWANSHPVYYCCVFNLRTSPAEGGCVHTNEQFVGHFSKCIYVLNIIKMRHFVFFYVCGKYIFNYLYFTTTVNWQLLCSATPPPAALNLVRSIMWGGTVPLTSVYGEFVSTPAILRASVGFVIRRMNWDAGGSMKSWALGHGSVANRELMLFIRRPCLSFAVNTQ